MKGRAFWSGAAGGLWLAIATATGCAHPFTGAPGPGSTPPPSPNGSAAPSPSPGVCATQDPSALLVYMTANAAPTVDPNYGPLFGYTAGVDGGTGQPSPAAILTAHQNAHVQFVNYDSGQTHSAAGVPGPLFPPKVPNPFPSGASQPMGAAISALPWSTGILAPFAGFYCFSQSFSTPTNGTYLFGDLQTYGSTNTRDVLVISP